MLNSFMSIDTITRGLYIQQLNQNIIASNLAQTYLDSNGYLMNSMQQLNVMEGPSVFLGGGTTGLMAVGTGPLAQSITRLRNSFLDSQIQQESSIVGKSEIINNVLNQVNTILNGSAGTVDAAITNFANAFAALAPSPQSIALRSTVVNDGVAFANLAHNQYNQLQNLQQNLSSQVAGTVSDINGILQQLSSLNKQLLNSSGTNVNSLLDARDYALDRLSRLINIQTSFGTAGTANVFLAGSSLSLVDSAGAGILQTDVMNPHDPSLADVTIQSSEGTVTMNDASNWIIGGNLGGELQARNVVLESYKNQLDQITTSVMNVSNLLHQSGYAANGVTTGTVFFTGTGAQDIAGIRPE
jgi:flagellar hook-associated protein 1 FlgK